MAQMDFDIVGIILRWMHILAAIALFGGTIFQRLALVPAARELDDAQHARLAAAIRAKWSRVVMVAILFLLVSGVVNFMLTIKLFKAEAAEQKLPAIYHALIGIKILLALAVFFIASALAGRSEGTQRFRDNLSKWLTVNLILATMIVCISGVLRSTHSAPNKPASAATSLPPSGSR
jgi:uncharacterized membrane protein